MLDLQASAEVHNDARSEELVVRFLEPHAQWDTRPCWQDYARLNLEQNGLRRICLWGEEGAISVFRTRLRFCLKRPSYRQGDSQMLANSAAQRPYSV